jgi:hypothetical protein
MWFRATSNNTSFARLFDMWSGSNFSMFINASPDGIGLQTAGINGYIFTGTVRDDVWRHITLTIAYAGTSGASSVYKCYINGTLQTTTVAAYPALGLRTSYNLGTVLNFGNGGAESFDGGLDDFRVYHRAITADEVSAIYSQPVVYFPFETADISLSAATKVGDLATGTYVYNGTLVNGATIAVDAGSRVSGKGYLSLVAASNQYMTPSSFVIGTKGFTYSCWFRSNGSGNLASIFEFSNSFTDRFAPVISADKLFMLLMKGGNGGYNAVTSFSVNDNVWRHIVFIATGTSASVIYLNGVLYTLGAGGSFYPSAGASTNYIGNNPRGQPFFNGGIDDFRFFNRALTSTEVSALYAGPLPPALKDTVTGATWTSKPAITLDDIETSYTVKSNEIALKPGTNSTYAIWTAPKSTNIRVDVSFADYHSRSVGVGFQMFKINNDNTFGSTIFPRTVTSAVITDVSSNYLSVPSTSLSVATGDKVVYRIDANGNTTAASSVLATNIYSYSGIWN